MTELSFNLAEEPWITCLRRDGNPDTLNLREVLVQAHDLREITGESPVVVAGLYRLLLTLLYRVYKPFYDEDWQDLWEQGHWEPEKMGAYLQTYHDRFDLFHPQYPFFQTLEEIGKPLSLAALAHDMASGNNATLFDHHMDTDQIRVSPAYAARLVVATQYFAVGGGNSGIKGKNFTNAVCCRGILFLFNGKNLFETLAINLVPYYKQPLYKNLKGEGLPAWENEDIIARDPSLPEGFLEYMTWLSRRLKLIPDIVDGELTVTGVYRSQALSIDRDAKVFDPMKLYLAGKQGYYPLSWQGERALWRDSASLFMHTRETTFPPVFIDWVAHLCKDGVLPSSARFQCKALGMAAGKIDLDPKASAGKVQFMRAETLPLHLDYLNNPEFVSNLENLLERTENVDLRLINAVNWLALLIISPNSRQKQNKKEADKLWVKAKALQEHWGVRRLYWADLEPKFMRLIVDLPNDLEGAVEHWWQTLKKAAWRAFGYAEELAGDDARALRARVRGRGQLARSLKKIFPEE